MKRWLSSRRPWLLLVLGLGGLGAFLVFSLHLDHERIEAVERERLNTQSKVIQDNLSRQLVAINLVLESIMADLPRRAGQPDAQERGVRRLKSMVVSMPSVRTFEVLDAKGIITLSSREELIGFNSFEREYFQAHLRSKNRTVLHVSAPFKSVLGVYVINLTRAITGPEGEFAGLVSATLDPVDIQILLNSVRYADDMRSMLVHGDGKVFVSQPALAGVMDLNLSAPSSFFNQHIESKRAMSEFAGVALTTEKKRLTLLRTVQPPELAMDKPLIVSVSREWDALFAPWLRDVRSQLVAYLLLVLLSSVGLSVYLRQRGQQRLINQRLKLATEATGVGIWELDLSRRRYHWDTAMFDMFGLDRQSVNALNNDWQQLLLPGERQRMTQATRATIKQGQAFDLTFQIRRPDGQLRFLRNRAALHEEGTGLPTRLIGTTEDVTERKMREADLRIAAAAFKSHESMLITDANAVILRVNHAFSALFGYTVKEVLGQTPRILQSLRHDSAFYAALWAAIARDGAWQGEIWNRRKNGAVFSNWLSISEVRNDEGVVTHFVATHTDITLRKAAEEKINLLAFFDPLTQLPNRRLLHDRLHQAVILAKRESRRLALIFIDLDKCKPVNDEFGHLAGDELLQAVAHRLLACVRESDTVARVGGDEFVLLLPGIEDAADALGVAAKIHDVLNQPFTLSEGEKVSISSSVGIALYPDHALDETTLTSNADAAMYQAKTAGRDRFVLFQP